MHSNKELLDRVQKKVSEVREAYANAPKNNTVNILLYGDFGTGKTRAACTTMPTPVLVHSFDPGGLKTAGIQPLIESGDIIPMLYDYDTWKNPRAFKEWERDFQELVRMDFFSSVGTFVFDSITKWSDYMMYEIISRGTSGKSRRGQMPQIQDYGVQQMTAIDYMSAFMNLPCHVVVTGHIGRDKDEVTGKLETGLLLAGKMTTKVPLVFDEKYITKLEGDRFVIQVHSDGYWKAQTRVGGEKLDKINDPDLRAILKKAGVDIQNKPRIN